MAAQSERRYDIDWLRVLGMVAVFSFHILMFFNSWGWHVKNGVRWPALNMVNMVMIPWLMPLFFVISGMGTYYALARRSRSAFIRERLVRLGPPLLLAIVLLSPPQVYLERLTNGHFHGSFWAFLPHYFEGWYAITPNGNFAWMGLHLWYVFFLLLFCVITLPFLRRSDGPGLWERLGARTGAFGLLVAPAVLLLALRLVLDPEGLGAGNTGWPMLIYLTYYLLGYSLFPLASFREALRTRAAWLPVAAVLATVSGLWVDTGVPFGYTVGHLVGAFWWVGCAWLWLLAGFALAARYLNRTGSTLQYANQAVMPVYVLHQPVIVLLGYAVRTWAMAPWLKVGLLFTVAVAITLGLYHFLVRPFAAVQWLFGVKPSARGSQNSQSTSPSVASQGG